MANKSNKGKSPSATAHKELGTAQAEQATEQAPQPQPATTAQAPEKPAKKAREKKAPPPRETPAHMVKVQRYEASLPKPSEEAQAILDAAQNLSTGDLNVAATWLSLMARKRATATATTATLRVGDKVQIVSGSNSRMIGKVGTLTKVNRIRCFVAVPGFEREVYLFTSDIKPAGEVQEINIHTDPDEEQDKEAVNS